jgi:membrane protein
VRSTTGDDDGAETDVGDFDGAARGREAMAPDEIPARGWRDVVIRIKDEFSDDNTTLLAAGVAFYAFLSFVPGLAAVVSLYGLFRSPQEASDALTDLLDPLPEDAQQLLTDQISQVAGQSAAALSITVVAAITLALWSASGAVNQTMSAVGAIYDEDDDRGMLRNRGLALLLTLGAVGGAVLLIGALAFASSLAGWAGTLATVGVYVVAGVAVMAGLAVLYRLGPDRHDAHWQWVTPGAVVAVLLWLAATIGFQVYVSNLGSYQETYGALGAVVVLLLWLWLSALVVLLGAHVNAEMEHQTTRDTTVDGEQPIGERGAYVADTVGPIDAAD